MGSVQTLLDPVGLVVGIGYPSLGGDILGLDVCDVCNFGYLLKDPDYFCLCSPY